MKTVEVSGHTLEEALEAAAVELGVSEDNLGYEVVEEGSRGFAGLGQTPTIIKAWVLQAEEQSAVVEVDAAESSDAPAPDEDKADYAQAALDVLGLVLPAMGLDAKAMLTKIESDYIYIDIEGKDLALLIGKHGQTLDALQYLLQIAALRKTRKDARIVLDAEGYRVRYNKMLENKALEYAEAVTEQQKEAVLDPQSAKDRRIIHLALADHPTVYTYSEGFGDERHVVISPKH